MADWIQRSITRHLLGSGPSRWHKAYSQLISTLGENRIFWYNGVHDNDLANIHVYSNALFEIQTSDNTERQRNRSNWDHGASGSNVVELAANRTTPTPPDRHEVAGLCPDDGFIYLFQGVSTNITFTRTFESSDVNDVGDYIDFDDPISPLYTGSIVRFTTTGTLAGGLAINTTYWAIRDGNNRLGFANSYANARAGNRLPIDATGSGTHTMTLQTATSGIGNQPSDQWRIKYTAGGAQYVYEQLFPSGTIPYNVPGQAAPTAAAAWYPPLSCFIVMGLNTDGFTAGNRTTWLYYPASNTWERLSAYTANNGGPLPGSNQCMGYDPDNEFMWFFGGGETAGGNQLWRFADDKTWTQVTADNSHPPSRVNHGVCFANGKLWIVGGEATFGGTNIVDFWSYDPSTNEFTEDEVAALPSSANFTYLGFDGTELVLANNLLEIWTNAIPSVESGVQVTITSDLETDNLISASVSVSVNVNSDLETDLIVSANVQSSILITSDLETETILSADVETSILIVSDLEIETQIEVSVNSTVQINSDLETDSAISASVGNSSLVVSDIETESFVTVSAFNSAELFSDLELETLITAQVANSELSAFVTSDLETDSIISASAFVSAEINSDLETDSAIVINNLVQVNATSDLETESAIAVNINIGASLISNLELESLISALNNILVEISNDLEMETLITGEVEQQENLDVAIISDIELESAISALSDVITEIISDIQIESVITGTVGNTSLAITNRFDRQIKTGLKLIAKNGQKVIWQVISETLDNQEPWKSDSQVTENHVVSICFLPANKQTLESIAFRAGIEIPKGCFLGYMGGVDFEPNLKDIVIRGDIKLSVFYIDKLSPNGQNLLYTLLLKQ